MITSRGLIPGTTDVTDSKAGRMTLKSHPHAAGHLGPIHEQQQSSQPVQQPSNPQPYVLLTPPQRKSTNMSTKSGSSTSSSKMSLKFWKKRETLRGDPELRHFFEGRDIVRHLYTTSVQKTNVSSSCLLLTMAQV
jgi:hypothetical protein